MAMSLASVLIYPSDAPKRKKKIGAMQTTANGSRVFIQRVNGSSVPFIKSEWPLSFRGVSETIRAQLEAIFNLATTMTYVDQHGTGYSVICPEDGYDESIAVIAADGSLRYDVSLLLVEA